MTHMQAHDFDAKPWIDCLDTLLKQAGQAHGLVNRLGRSHTHCLNHVIHAMAKQIDPTRAKAPLLQKGRDILTQDVHDLRDAFGRADWFHQMALHAQGCCRLIEIQSFFLVAKRLIKTTKHRLTEAARQRSTWHGTQIRHTANSQKTKPRLFLVIKPQGSDGQGVECCSHTARGDTKQILCAETCQSMGRSSRIRQSRTNGMPLRHQPVPYGFQHGDLTPEKMSASRAVDPQTIWRINRDKGGEASAP